MNPEELKKIIDDHKLWLNRSGGARANLTDADLTDADLTGADLAGADLARANLTGADLADAIQKPDSLISHVDPTEPYQRTANHQERRKQRAENYRKNHPEVPVVEHLDAKILEALSSGGSLEMGSWHSCETTHCRAGWAIHLAGKEGYDLEKALGGPEFAGRAIYLASTGRCPHFYASNKAALADIKREAGQ